MKCYNTVQQGETRVSGYHSLWPINASHITSNILTDVYWYIKVVVIKSLD
jgi:hypothetical protein